MRPVTLAVTLFAGLAMTLAAPARASLELLHTELAAAVDSEASAATLAVCFRLRGADTSVSVWLLQPPGVTVRAARGGLRAATLGELPLSRSSPAPDGEPHVVRRSALLSWSGAELPASSDRTFEIAIELDLAVRSRSVALPIPRLVLPPPAATPTAFSAVLALDPRWRFGSTVPVGWRRLEEDAARYRLDLQAAPSVLELSLRRDASFAPSADLLLDALALGLLAALMALGVRHLRRAASASGSSA